MAISRNQLVFGLVALFWLVIPGSSGISAEINNCLTCHQPHRALQGSCVFCHAGNPVTQRKEIAHYRLIAARFSSFRDSGDRILLHGKKLVESLGCRRCHRIGDEGNRLATDLDLLSKRVTPEGLESSLENPVLFMPDFHLEPPQRAAVITYLLAARLKVPPTSTPPKIVHFALPTNSDRVFEKHCGQCHQVLSTQWGALGTGKIGPNLSGLFSKFYPTPPKKDKEWTEENLKLWLKNPRTFRPLALMPPLSLKNEELSNLIQELGHE